jgi:hypothetical protein
LLSGWLRLFTADATGCAQYAPKSVGLVVAAVISGLLVGGPIVAGCQPCIAELSRSLDQGAAAARRRWPGSCAGLCLGRPARRKLGHNRNGTQINPAHMAH